ncbi:nitrate regulatory gene2 protein-like [Humulus lupulus]|uniref:nitrate regulatory gene2 protein-like n=1 Tax=Humulus lupulus TaxID=3486 RepID=UPI002B40C7B6|nr:nitrate regulatory gene2 protein-like [Humulus lupulus]XP_062101500.1 nitrate regulatory gene2 protein-like [Humulus lupulus]XP_062101501.1 nitrate regulatory gene2 protein-like [Humulus lupulus]XP_062101502.1 nitrate regulatory gene2 protein-like [Humulus lupulus]
MGCGTSKVDDLPLVTLCRERRDLIKTASDHRYALAAAHVSYFQSLNDIGNALRKFVDEELVVADSSSSTIPGSPVLTLPSDEGKKKKKKNPGGGGGGGVESKNSSSSTSISISHLEEEEGIEDSHLHLSSGSDSDSELDSSGGHIHMEDSPSGMNHGHGHGHDHSHGHSHGHSQRPFPQSYPQSEIPPGSYPPNYWSSQIPPGSYPPNYWSSQIPPETYPPQSDWNSQTPTGNGVNSYMYYAKRSGTTVQSRVYEEPETERFTTSAAVGQYAESSYGYPGNPQYGGGGFFGFSMSSPRQQQSGDYQYRQPSPPPAPPSPPRVSTWDYLNFFDTYDNSGYPANYPAMRYGYGSNTSSPDSNEVREREGIPELEDETDAEGMKVKAKKKMNEDNNFNRHKNSGEVKKKMLKEETLNRNKNSGEGTSRAVPSSLKSSEGSSWPMRSSDSPESIPETEIKSSSETVDTIDTSTSKSPEEEGSRKKGVSFEIDESPNVEDESSKMSSLTTLSVHGTRDLQEVVREIKDEFETASTFGKEVAVLLEVGKLPYQPRATSLKVIVSRILYIIAPSMLSSRTPPRRPVRLSSRTLKLAKAYGGVPGKDFELKSGNLSSTLEKLYAWEKKLYKEVKVEERLRVIYDKMCKRLKYLDEHGAESMKIDATQASIRKLLTKINVCIKAVDAIASRIHKLRDEELLPQITELIHGLIRMWKSMFKCHQKQFQAIMESKMRSLRVHTSSRREAGLKATVELEMELLNWCNCFNNWITMQKSYVDSLNGWLLRCLLNEPEETADGIAPFSPSRIGAPAIFVICNDWFQAMERISEQGVSKAMNEFAGTLRQLWERQDEEQRQRIKAEFLSKDVDKRLRHLRMENGKLEQDRDASSDKTALSKVHSGSGISPLDDLKVDLDSMRKKLSEERARHREAIKLVHDAASNSLQAGLTPIFEALGNFTSEVLKAHEQVRLKNSEES